MAPCEGIKALRAIGAMPEIGFQQTLHRYGRLIGLDVAQHFSADRPFIAEAAAEDDMIAIDGVAFFIDGDARADQADVADIMLRAGMMAAGEMDVDGLVERDPVLAPARDILGMALGVGSGEFATL